MAYVLKDGMLKGDAFQLGYCDSKKRLRCHPDTGIAFDGYQIPCVPKIVEEAKRMHVKLPHLQYISWDFTVDSEERVVLIEANLFGQSVWFPQIVSGKGLFDEMDE